MAEVEAERECGAEEVLSPEEEAEHRDNLTNIKANLEGSENTKEDHWTSIQTMVTKLIEKISEKCKYPELREIHQRRMPAEGRRRTSMQRNQAAR